ncbi:MAG: hypothetical protein MHM6MM_000557 [Cercozoa sp. M6MM]
MDLVPVFDITGNITEYSDKCRSSILDLDLSEEDVTNLAEHKNSTSQCIVDKCGPSIENANCRASCHKFFPFGDRPSGVSTFCVVAEKNNVWLKYALPSTFDCRDDLNEVLSSSTMKAEECGLSAGAIAGGTVAFAAFVVFFVFLMHYLMRPKHRSP